MEPLESSKRSPLPPFGSLVPRLRVAACKLQEPARAVLLLMPVWGAIVSLCVYSLVRIPEITLPPLGSDPFFFDVLSEVIRSKGILLRGLPEYFFTPAYAYFYALVKGVFPDVRHCLSAVIVAQSLLFCASVYWFYRCAAILTGAEVWSAAAATVYGLFPPFLFYAVLPLKDIVTVSALVFGAYAWICHERCRRPAAWIACGLAYGLALHLRGSLILTLPILCWAAYRCFGGRAALVFVGAASLLIAPFSLRNAVVAGEPVLLSSVGGIHAYIGSNQNATGYYAYVPGVRPDGFGHYYDAVRLASDRTGSDLTGPEANRYWKGEAVRFVTTHPRQALKLFGRKLLLILNGAELPNNYSFEYFTRNYGPFRALGYFPLGHSLLVVCGVGGLLCCRFRHRHLLLACFGAVVFASCLGFINGRYRVVVSVLLFPPALAFLRTSWRERLRNVGKARALPILCVAIVAFWPVELDRERYLAGARRKHESAARILARAESMEPEEFSRYYAGRRTSFVARYTPEKLIE